MASPEPLEPAQRLLPKGPVYSAQPLHNFQPFSSLPKERGVQSQRVVPAAMGVAQQVHVPLYNSPTVIPVPQTTLYHHQERAPENQRQNQKEKIKYQQTTMLNACRHCQLPKTEFWSQSAFWNMWGGNLLSFCRGQKVCQ